MPDLSTNFTGSGITTTSSGAAGDGPGGAYASLFASLPPELVQLLKTKIATQQANANMGMRNAQNTEMRQGMGGVLGYGPRALGAATPDPAVGRMQVANQLAQQTAQQQQMAAAQERAQEAMLARQAQSEQQKAGDQVMPGKDKPYRLGGTLIDPTLGVDASEYLTEHGYGPAIAGRIMSGKG